MGGCIFYSAQDGTTAMLDASKSATKEVLELLLAAGADPQAVDHV